MSREPDFHELARKEIREVYAWYRARSERASTQFLRKLDQAIMRLMDDPESFPVLGRGYRFLKVGKYPYVIVFQVRPDQSVFITAIAHTSRRTGYWRRRKE